MAARQIQVTCGSVTNRKSVVLSSGASLRSAFEEAEVDYAGATVQVDGINIGMGDLDRSFDDLGITGDKCMLIATVKADNAIA